MALLASVKQPEIIQPAAKETSRKPVELFRIALLKDKDGIEREIPESIGVYSAEQIQTEINQLTARIAELQEKLDAVNVALLAEEA